MGLEFVNYFEGIKSKAEKGKETLKQMELISRGLIGLDAKSQVILLGDALEGVIRQAHGSTTRDYFHAASNTGNLKRLFAGRFIFRSEQEALYLETALSCHTLSLEFTKLLQASSQAVVAKTALQPAGKSDPAEVVAWFHRFEQIVCCMIPDSKVMCDLDNLHKKIDQYVKKGISFQQCQNELENQSEAVFIKVLDQLVELLEKQPALNKSMFFDCIRRDLDYLKIRSERQGDFCRFLGRLIDFYDSQINYADKVKLEYPASIKAFNLQRQVKRVPAKAKKTAPPKPDGKPVMTFKYVSKVDYIAELVDYLIDKEAIPRGTSVPDFRRNFSGKKVEQRIPWLAGAGNLKVFMVEVTRLGKLVFPRQQLWNITCQCFEKPDGSLFKASSLKVAKATKREDEFLKAAGMM